MQAIETFYKGYRFRSRLEARWAVFFDAMNIEWQYEVEGYKFDDGTMYLPDFWLPKWDRYAEVKGSPIIDEESHKIYQLSRGSGKQVLLLTSSPFYQKEKATWGAAAMVESIPTFVSVFSFWRWFKIDTTDGVITRNLRDVMFGNCPKCGKANIFYSAEWAWFFDPQFECCDDVWYLEKKDIMPGAFINSMKCFEKARAARFEHGEKG